MKLTTVRSITALLLVAVAQAQRPNTTSICDYYANKVAGNNTAATQYLLMTLILNTAFLGNYSTYSSGVAVNGVATAGEYKGTPVNDLPFFDAGYASANDFKTPHGVAKSFLDDGGPVPLSKNLPSNGNTSSLQYNLLTHAYQIFGLLLNCSLQGTSPDFPAYQGKASMYEVHKYMDLDYATFGYFIEQTRLAALSLGFSSQDAQTWFDIQNNAFGFRCAPPQVVDPKAPAALQSFCLAENCPLAPNAQCDLYPNNGLGVPPGIQNATLVGNVTTSWTNMTGLVSQGFGQNVTSDSTNGTGIASSSGGSSMCERAESGGCASSSASSTASGSSASSSSKSGASSLMVADNAAAKIGYLCFGAALLLAGSL